MVFEILCKKEQSYGFGEGCTVVEGWGSLIVGAGVEIGAAVALKTVPFNV